MNPYESLSPKKFWKLGVADHQALAIPELWTPKFRIAAKHKIATYGSCFAQHFSRSLIQRGYSWLCTEKSPEGLSKENASLYNYEVFSTRTGNIYTVSLLKQWLSWAFEIVTPPSEVWEEDGRFYDPFRPRIEPNGFASAEELFASRDMTIKAFRKSVEDADVFVFTLGLTESWINSAHGYEYPMCPGTVAGVFDPQVHKFVNQMTDQIKADLLEAISLLRKGNPKLRVLLTVSPVPLTATMSDDHVLVATTWSKSVLRAVAGEVANSAKRVDYFPSYEIITSPVFSGQFFAKNLRSVKPEGVAHVMENFFAGQKRLRAERFSGPEMAENAVPAREKRGGKRRAQTADEADDVVCEEELLAAFARSSDHEKAS